MTRILSELLGVHEPVFRHNIQQLEYASGAPSADIRLTSEILRLTQLKIRELGLDPHDTTGPELYNTLIERLKNDEGRVREALHIAEDAAPSEIMSAVQRFVDKLDAPKTCFAVKISVAKRLLKKLPPKRAMKYLGYRSLESFLKHEPVARIYAAAMLLESTQWRKDFIDQYKALKPSDFESRRIEVILPRTKRWVELAKQLTAQYKHNSICFKELGTVVLLPVEPAVPGVALISLLFTLFEMNEIRCTSTFLKLQQVKPQFGEIVVQVISDEPYTSATLAGQPIPWQILQRYYGTFSEAYRPELFEPHVQAEDLQWHHVEETLAQALPVFEFWQDTIALGFLDNGEPISLNIFDVALSYCNQLSFNDRIVHFLRDNLWHELMLRYLHQDALEQTVLGQLSNELVGEPVLI